MPEQEISLKDRYSDGEQFDIGRKKLQLNSLQERLGRTQDQMVKESLEKKVISLGAELEKIGDNVFVAECADKASKKITPEKLFEGAEGEIDEAFEKIQKAA